MKAGNNLTSKGLLLLLRHLLAKAQLLVLLLGLLPDDQERLPLPELRRRCVRNSKPPFLLLQEVWQLAEGGSGHVDMSHSWPRKS